MKKKPHIIIFNPDQMQNAALGHMGKNRAAQTPFLDEFAETEAVSYRNAFCQNPVCVPSRCSFLTGLYPHVYGHRTMNHALHSHESSIFMELKNTGYYVWMNARNDFLPGQEEAAFERHADEIFYGCEVPRAPGPENPNARGEAGNKNYYSHYVGCLKTDQQGLNYSGDDEAVDAAIARIKNPTDDRPLCLFLGLVFPHPDYAVEEPYFSAIDRSKLPPRVKDRLGDVPEPKIESMIREGQNMEEYTEADWDELRACYAGMCLKVDTQFKKLCDALKEEGIYDDCAIFFFSDHGDYQGHFGLSEKNQNTFYDSLTNVPFLIKPPKGVDVDPGISDSLVELVDFYATAMDFAQTEPDHTHFGISLRESIGSRALPVRDYVCCEGGRLKGEVHCDESHAMGAEGANPDSTYWPRQMAQEDDTAHTKATMLRTKQYKYVRRLYEEDQLFDMVNDPGERKNLIMQDSMGDIAADLRLRMLDWYQATCDIVPFEYDVRFTFDMIWCRVKKFCPPDREDEVKKLIRANSKMHLPLLMKKCFELCKQM